MAILEQTLSGPSRPGARISDIGQPATDGELLEASKRGERAAFGELVVRYQGLVCAVSLSGTRDRVLAEDVAREAFVAAWHNLG